jgi:class 3 adenylate cyclase
VEASELADEIAPFERRLERDDLEALIAKLLAMGATSEEIVASARAGRIGVLGLEVALRTGRLRTLSEAASEAGLDVDTAARLFMALGFPDPRLAAGRYDEATVEAMRFLVAAQQLFGGDMTGALLRSVGAEAARLAETIVDAFRAEVEAPQLGAGVRYTDVVQQYGDAVRELLPPFITVFGTILRQHMIRVAAGRWTFDEEARVVRTELCVGFVDLVGYTALTNSSTSAMLQAVTRFEDLTAEVVGRHGGRLVKLIGDGAMFVVDDPSEGCRLVLDLARTCERELSLPAVRIALAWGTVVAAQGDYYGEVVNLAARLVAVADPGTVVVTEEVARAGGDGTSVELLPARTVKGFDEPVTAYRLRAP